MTDLEEALVGACPDAIIVSNGTGCVVAANPAAAALTGFDLDDLIGRPLIAIAEADMVAAMKRMMQNEDLIIDSASLQDCSMIHRSGERRRVDVRVTRLDVADDTYAAAYLRPTPYPTHTDELAAFRSVLDAVIADRELPEVLDIAARAACELFGADGASVARHDPYTNSVEVIAACGDLGRFLGTRVDVSGSRVEAALRQGAPVHFVEGGLLSRRSTIDPGPAFGELWIAPLTVDGEDFAVLVVGAAPRRRLAPEIEQRLPRFVEVINLGLEVTEANRHRSTLAVVADHERIARDLHDVVIQRLIASAMRLESMTPQIDPDLRSRLGKVIDDLDQVTRDIRATVFDLQRDEERSDIAREIVDLTASTGEAFGLDTSCVIHDEAMAEVPEGLRAHLLAVVREALSNVGRHAQATAASVEVVVADPIVLTVIDNGVGLPAGPTPGNGLRNLAVRAEELGGALTLQPSHPTGTVLRWQIPWPRTAGSEPTLATDL